MQASAPRSLYSRPAFACAVIALVTLALYWRVNAFPFIVYDDQEYITANPRIQGGLTPAGLVWAFTTFHASNWHPLTWISHMLDVTLFNLNPGGPHIVNVLLHTANACLLFYLCLRLFGYSSKPAAGSASVTDQPATARNILLAAFFVAAVFAWHPLRVESVAWISERKDVLSTLFALLTLLAYLNSQRGRHDEREEQAASSSTVVSSVSDAPLLPGGSTIAPEHRANAWARYRLKKPLLFFALALLAKPMPVTLPLVLLLLDYWPLGRFDFLPEKRGRALQSVREKIPFFILSAICAGLTLVAQRQAGAVKSVAELSIGNRLGTAVVAYVTYLKKLFWPAHLAVPYLHPGSFPVTTVLLCLLCLAVISAVVFSVLRCRGARVGWVWFVVTLIPVIGLVQVGSQWIADRYTYFPAIGIFVAVACGALGWRAARVPFCALALLFLLACVWWTNAQLGYWSNSVALFHHTLTLEPRNYLARNYLAAGLFEKGDIDGAISEYQKTLAQKPGAAFALDGLGSALLARGDNEAAREAFEKAVRANPASADAQNNLGVALGRLGRGAEAMAAYQRSLQLAPDNPEAHCNIANLLANQGKYEDAIRQYYIALKINPRHLPALNNAAYLLGMTGKMKMSTNLFEQAVKLDPKNAEVRCTYGDVLAAQKLYQSAFHQYEGALKVNPNSGEAYAGLASLLLSHGQTNEAKRFVERAAQLSPNDERIKAMVRRVLSTNAMSAVPKGETK